jgi:hypothetical protein
MGDWALLTSFKLREHGIWSKEAAHTLQNFIPVKTSVLIVESILMASYGVLLVLKYTAETSIHLQESEF